MRKLILAYCVGIYTYTISSINREREHFLETRRPRTAARCHARHRTLGRLQGRHCNSLRATSATLLLDSGAAIEAVQDLLDHKHITTTQIYDKRRRAIVRVLCPHHHRLGGPMAGIRRDAGHSRVQDGPESALRSPAESGLHRQQEASSSAGRTENRTCLNCRCCRMEIGKS